MERSWDPEVEKYFRKILNSISYGLLWLMSMVTAGIYFQLAIPGQVPLFYTILFYAVLLLSLWLLLLYYYRIWRAKR